ncbi:MAG: hypothetical protein GY705_00010 [Bacteroidetes bacterium]|nr:hypothetical protein [Bacteroidota bacterium]
MRKNSPVRAAIADGTFLLLSALGANHLDNSIATIADPDATTGEKVAAGAEILTTTRGGKGPKGGKIHGNSKASNKLQHHYEIKDKKGNIVDQGISGRKLNKDGTSPRANRKLNTKLKGQTDLKARVTKQNIGPKNGRTARENALNHEQGKVNSFAKSPKNPNPGTGPKYQNKPKPNY